MQQQQPESLFQSIKRVENLPHPIFMGDRNKDPYGPRGLLTCLIHTPQLKKTISTSIRRVYLSLQARLLV
ncbi:hypothetical protein WJX75_002664 [Coccomyxa subellipsoidea]|uniref:Uncharacterized protein n=1 Tax=Coccomyxa subellipsoidea TaxID=248742 RepID=A0ABR2Z2Q4_9CHLO